MASLCRPLSGGRSTAAQFALDGWLAMIDPLRQSGRCAATDANTKSPLLTIYPSGRTLAELSSADGEISDVKRISPEVQVQQLSEHYNGGLNGRSGGAFLPFVETSMNVDFWMKVNFAQTAEMGAHSCRLVSSSGGSRPAQPTTRFHVTHSRFARRHSSNLLCLLLLRRSFRSAVIA